MKRLIFLAILAFGLVLQGNAGIIILQGVYQGKNLYVQNPFAGSGVGFCTYEVTVNGDITTDEINSSAFEIDFSAFSFKLGDPVEVKIKHQNDCRPKVLNPEVLKPKSTFEVIDIKVEDAILKWKTKNETGKLDYIIEQYRWNKWVKAGEVEGKGSVGEQDYEFQIEPHSGENKVRVKQVDYSNKPRYSPEAVFTDPDVTKVVFSPTKVRKEIIFTAPTKYEVFDAYGNIVKKGFANRIDVENLQPGVYYLNYDAASDRFIKK